MKLYIRSIPFLILSAFSSIVQARNATSNLRGGENEIESRHLTRKKHGFLVHAVHASNEKPRFIRGNLGKLNNANDNAIANSARQSLKKALSAHCQAKGTEILNLVRIDKNKNKNEINIHVRFQQEVNGIPVEGTSLTVNSDPEGNILAINGCTCDEDAVATEHNLDGEAALAKALEQYGQSGIWIGTPTVMWFLTQTKIVSLLGRILWSTLLKKARTLACTETLFSPM